MTLIVMTVVVVALMIAVLAAYLFVIGVALNRTADNLGDCLESVRTVVNQASIVGPGIKRLNKTGGELLEALPLLLEDAEGVAAKLAPSAHVSAPAPAAAAVPAGSSSANQAGVGYLDPASTKGVGYMDT
jgi:hypothetical protein